MTKSRTKNSVLNILFALILQLVTVVSGLILPRLIIPKYGSDINGLIASITQALSFISLLEAGMGAVFRSSLYKHLKENDWDEVSSVVVTQKNYYKKIGYVFIVYVVILCVVLPFILKTSYDYFYIIALTLILSIGTFLEYFISLPYSSLINADQKVRIIYLVSIIYYILNLGITSLLVLLNANIIFIKLFISILAIIKPIVYTIYVKKHYKLNNNAPASQKALEQRWNGVTHHIAYFIHNNTDVLLLSIFVSTSAISVYSIYLAVASGIASLVTAISTSVTSSFGNLLNENNKDKVIQVTTAFEFVQSSVATVLFTVTGLMIIPFMELYTANMTDANYIVPIFGYVLVFAEFLYSIRCIYVSISTSANKYKETQFFAIAECLTNLLVSIILILVFQSTELKLLGVAIGTCCGMFVRILSESFYLSQKVVCRNKLCVLKNLILCLVISSVSIILFAYLNLTSSTWLQWILNAIIAFVITFFVWLLVNFVFRRNDLIYFFNKTKIKK